MKRLYLIFIAEYLKFKPGIVGFKRFLRPNLKNLSRGLNFNRGSNMVGFTYNVLNFSRFKPAVN